LEKHREIPWDVLTVTLLDARFEVFAVVKIQVEVFWVVKPRSVVTGYQRFRGLCCLHLHELHPEDGGNKDLRNVGVLQQQHYTISLPRRPQLESNCDFAPSQLH
jgi:hypothetical protein